MLCSIRKILVDVVMGKNRGKGGYYAVRVGRRTGVFHTWDECKQSVNGFAGAKFKKFGSNEEALDFIGGGCSGGYSSQPSYSQSYSPTPSYQHSRKRSYTEVEDYPSTSCTSPGSACTLRSNKKFRKTQFLDTLPGTAICSSSSDSASSCSTSSSSTSHAVVYSDGSCTKNGYSGAKAGVGVYWGPEHPCNISERLPGKQTNQRAEIIAAAMALESAKSMGLKSVEVRTDSKYTINGVTSWIKTWKRNGWKTSDKKDVKNVEDFQKLDKLCEEIDVKWTHVAGHAGIHGNEEADQLAKKGASKSPV